MASEKRYLQTTWVGGLSEGSRVGYDGSFQDSQGLDYYTDPDKVTALPKLVKDSGSTVTDLVLWHANDGTNDWFYGNTGEIYKRDSNPTWSNPKTVSNSSGNGFARFRTFEDYVWYAYDGGIGRIEDATGTPVYNDNPFNVPTNEVLAFQSTGTGSGYTPPTSITENAANRISFTAGNYAVTGIILRTSAAGSGDWSLVLHDSSHAQVARITIDNGDINTTGLAFYSIGAVDLVDGDTYHWHVISTVADGTVEVGTSANLSTGRYAVLQYQDGDIVDQSNTITSGEVTQRYQQVITLDAVLSEDKKVAFTPTKNILRGIAPLVRSVAGGVSVTCVVHDANNNVVASKTIAGLSASVYSGYYEFEFDTPVKLQPDAEYHYHLYDTAGSTQVLAGTTSTYSTMYFKTITTVLTDAMWHPLKEYSNLLLVGNGNFLATIDDSQVYETEVLQFPENEKVRAIDIVGDLAVISTWVNDDISSSDDGRVYFWDGVSPTYVQYITTSGQVNAMTNDGGANLKVIAGNDGQIRLYNGDLPLFRRIKDIERNSTVEVYPGAMTTWQGYTLFGISDGTTTGVKRVVYMLGHKDNDYPISLNPAFPISTGTVDDDVKIGMVKGVSEDKLFVGWEDDGTYGVDLIDNDNDQGEVYFVTLRPKEGANREEEVTSVAIETEPLASGQSIEIQYKRNNESSFTSLGSMTYDASKQNIYKSFAIPSAKQRCLEMVFKVILKTTGADAPTVTAFGYEYIVGREDQMGSI